jgi:hypothetical protein
MIGLNCFLSLFLAVSGNLLTQHTCNKQLSASDAEPSIEPCWKIFKKGVDDMVPEKHCRAHMFSHITTEGGADPKKAAHFAFAANTCNNKGYAFVQYGPCLPYTLERNPILGEGFFSEGCDRHSVWQHLFYRGSFDPYCRDYEINNPDDVEIWRFGKPPKKYMFPLKYRTKKCSGQCARYDPICDPSLSLDPPQCEKGDFEIILT